MDPFTAVPTYSQRFQTAQRSLPDFSTRQYCKELFPPELHSTLEGEDLPPAEKRLRSKKKRNAEMMLRAGSSIGARNETAERVSQQAAQQGDEHAYDNDGDLISAQLGKERTLQLVEKLSVEEPEAPVDEDAENEEKEGGEEEDEDITYDDEEGGDYDAEAYFDDGDDMGYGEDDDDGGGGDVY
jgi:DNA-directed RNA polymerase III subunit RPC7